MLIKELIEGRKGEVKEEEEFSLFEQVEFTPEEALSEMVVLLRELVKQVKIMNLDPEYWEILVLDVERPTVIPRGTTKYLFDFKERGKLVAISFLSSSKDVKIEIDIDGNKFGGTPEQLYNAGLIGYNPTTFWLSRYDTAESKYNIWFTPSPPRDYHGWISFKMQAPPTEDVVFTYSAYRYRLR